MRLCLFSQYTIISGKYTGNGGASKSITGLGFQPAIVIVKANATEYAYFKSSTMAGNLSKDMYSSTAAETDKITSLDADGFTVGNTAPVNTNGIVYYFSAFKATASMYAGSYTGTDADRKIPGSGFRTEYTIICPDDTKPCYMVWNPSGDGLNYFHNSFDASENATASFCCSAINDGFYISTAGSSTFNNAGITYHYASWDLVAGESDVGSYASNQPDNTTITTSFGGTDFQPEFIIVRQSFAANSTPLRFGAQSGDNTLNSQNLAAYANGVKSIVATGFTIGTEASVNTTTGVPSANTYRWFAVGGGNASQVLPIKLLSFFGRKKNDMIKLEWATASEVNNDYFTIERSMDAINFEKIANVKGAGNSSFTNYYTIQDNSLLDEVVYYRLKQTDYDGKFSYSKIISIGDGDKDFGLSLYVYPNTDRRSVDVEFSLPETRGATLELSNMLGEVIQVIDLGACPNGNNQKEIDFENYKSGVYFILLKTSQVTISRKFIIY